MSGFSRTVVSGVVRRGPASAVRVILPGPNTDKETRGETTGLPPGPRFDSLSNRQCGNRCDPGQSSRVRAPESVFPGQRGRW